MTVLLGLLSAIAAGTSDFIGGLGSRQASPVAITTGSHLGGALVAVVFSLVITGTPSTADLLWGAAAGLGGAGGLLAIYIGYARARVGIAAPVAGVGAAALPTIVDSLTGGDSLTTLAIVGVVIGLTAIGLVSMAPSNTTGGSVLASLGYGLAGAAGIGTLLLGLAQAGEDAGMWPLAAQRTSGFLILLVVMLVRSESLNVDRAVLPHIVAIAVLGTAANVLFIVATRVGSTTVAAVVTSMFPAVTVLWAWRVFGERLRPVQIAGVALALVAVSLIAVG